MFYLELMSFDTIFMAEYEYCYTKSTVVPNLTLEDGDDRLEILQVDKKTNDELIDDIASRSDLTTLNQGKLKSIL